MAPSFADGSENLTANNSVDALLLWLSAHLRSNRKKVQSLDYV
jgi:hypothetical protein